MNKPAELALVPPPTDPDIGKRARAFKTTARQFTRRAKSEIVLAEVLPERDRCGRVFEINP